MSRHLIVQVYVSDMALQRARVPLECFSPSCQQSFALSWWFSSCFSCALTYFGLSLFRISLLFSFSRDGDEKPSLVYFFPTEDAEYFSFVFSFFSCSLSPPPPPSLSIRGPFEVSVASLSFHLDEFRHRFARTRTPANAFIQLEKQRRSYLRTLLQMHKLYPTN